MPAKSLDDYALDRRVAQADARDAYRQAVKRAREQLLRDYAKADTAWIAAQERHRVAVERVNSIRERYEGMGVNPLRDELAQVRYTLTPAYAQYMSPNDKTRARVLERMILAVLAQRGEDVS